MCRAARQPLPQFSDDDVLNFMVTEAVMAADAKDQERQEKERKRQEWKNAPVGSGPVG